MCRRTKAENAKEVSHFAEKWIQLKELHREQQKKIKQQIIELNNQKQEDLETKKNDLQKNKQNQNKRPQQHQEHQQNQHDHLQIQKLKSDNLTDDSKHSEEFNNSTDPFTFNEKPHKEPHYKLIAANNNDNKDDQINKNNEQNNESVKIFENNSFSKSKRNKEAEIISTTPNTKTTTHENAEDGTFVCFYNKKNFNDVILKKVSQH